MPIHPTEQKKVSVTANNCCMCAISLILYMTMLACQKSDFCHYRWTESNRYDVFVLYIMQILPMRVTSNILQLFRVPRAITMTMTQYNDKILDLLVTVHIIQSICVRYIQNIIVMVIACKTLYEISNICNVRPDKLARRCTFSCPYTISVNHGLNKEHMATVYLGVTYCSGRPRYPAHHVTENSGESETLMERYIWYLIDGTHVGMCSHPCRLSNYVCVLILCILLICLRIIHRNHAAEAALNNDVHSFSFWSYPGMVPTSVQYHMRGSRPLNTARSWSALDVLWRHSADAACTKHPSSDFSGLWTKLSDVIGTEILNEMILTQFRLLSNRYLYHILLAQCVVYFISDSQVLRLEDCFGKVLCMLISLVYLLKHMSIWDSVTYVSKKRNRTMLAENWNILYNTRCVNLLTGHELTIARIAFDNQIQNYMRCVDMLNRVFFDHIYYYYVNACIYVLVYLVNCLFTLSILYLYYIRVLSNTVLLIDLGICLYSLLYAMSHENCFPSVKYRYCVLVCYDISNTDGTTYFIDKHAPYRVIAHLGFSLYICSNLVTILEPMVNFTRCTRCVSLKNRICQENQSEVS